MPTTEKTTAATTSRNGHSVVNDEQPQIAEQMMLTGADFASKVMDSIRKVLDGTVSAIDNVVNGGFDIADQLVRSTLASDVAVKGIAAGRQSWAIGVDSYRGVLSIL